jgi:large subunit ribosomal protein L15
MQLHELSSKNKKRGKKRVGRGGKRGTTSGKGQKGQRSRSGHHIRPAERDIISKFPKLRGIKNRSGKEPAVVLNLSEMAALAKDGKLDRRTLLEKGIIKKLFQPVKILSNGDVKSAVSVEGIRVSAGAKAKIEKAGGSVK